MGTRPLHLDRQRWLWEGKGSRGKMQWMRAGPQVLVAVGMVVGKELGAQARTPSTDPVEKQR
jgi:hypothetical protein